MIPTVIAPHTPDASLRETPDARGLAIALGVSPWEKTALAPVNPLRVLRQGRQSVALAGWGSSDLVSNQTDMISALIITCSTGIDITPHS
jgi:hypothetical protein